MWIDHAAVSGEAGVASHEMTVVPAVGANAARRSGLARGRRWMWICMKINASQR